MGSKIREKVINDICVVTCHFNFADYMRPKANLRRFQRQMEKDGVPVFGIEVYLKHQTPITTGWNGWTQFQIPRHAILWQKEALMNACVERVPEAFTKIACVDADVWFERPDWLQATSKALDKFKVVQPFSVAVWGDEDGKEIQKSNSCAALRQNEYLDGHPGFAVAARRELWTEQLGLFHLGVCGHGDTISMCGFLGLKMKEFQLAGVGGTLDADINTQEWARVTAIYTRKKVGLVEGTVFHEWHGSRKNRRYCERNDDLKHFNPLEHIETHEDGYLLWSRNTPARMMVSVEQYFIGRKEDGE